MDHNRRSNSEVQFEPAIPAGRFDFAAKMNYPSALSHWFVWNKAHFDHFRLEVLPDPVCTNPQASPSWPHFGPKLAPLGPKIVQLGPYLVPAGSTWRQLGLKLATSWGKWDRLFIIPEFFQPHEASECLELISMNATKYI